MNEHDFLSTARDAARSAGKMLVENMGASRQVHYKGAIDLVTDFDRKAQAMIFSHLSKKFPDHDFLAEEDLSRNRGSECRWLIDPIDGTTNFAHRFPFFCVSIALQKNAELVLGVIYDPTRDEMFTASKGEGAFLNGKAVGVSPVSELDKSLLVTGFPYDIRTSPDNNLNHFSNFALRAQAVRRCGSAALDLSYLACGRFDGFWELKLKPWDVAAGALIVLEAGGCVTDFSGEKVDIFNGEILASNGRIHSSMMEVLDSD